MNQRIFTARSTKDVVNARYTVITSLLSNQHVEIYAAQDRQTLEWVTLHCVHYLFLLDAPDNRKNFARIQEATRQIRNFEGGEPYYNDVHARHALLQPLDQFFETSPSELIVYTVLEPMNHPQTIDQFIHFIRSYNLEVGERLLARVIRSLLGAVQHIHRAGYLHGELRPQHVMIEIVDGFPIVRLVEFRAIMPDPQRGRMPTGIKGLWKSLESEEADACRILAYITQRAREKFKVVSTNLYSLEQALHDAPNFEAIASHPFIKG